ncbi:MAG: hypothetical protein IPG89_20555 [Bacteroidetes bacterium]|nr:hypothetical protein [Bacteroidota bacterium]
MKKIILSVSTAILLAACGSDDSKISTNDINISVSANGTQKQVVYLLSSLKKKRMISEKLPKEKSIFQF